MIFNFLMAILMSTSFAQSPKKKVRKPNQAQEYYFSCAFFKQGTQDPIFEFSMKSPSNEKEIVYEESNRAQTLMVKVMKSGYVQFFFYNERPKALLASGSVETHFQQNFEVVAPGLKTQYSLTCKN